MSLNNNPSKSIFTVIIHKLLVVAFATICVLSTAASCSLNPFGGNSKPISTLGMLKLTPDSKDFVAINNVQLINGKSDPEGLTGLSVIKVKQINSDTIFIQTLEKGLFKTTNGGQDWSRIYIFPVEYTEDKEELKILEAQLKKNDDISVKDFWVSPADSNVIYIAAKDLDQGKIFKSTDGGKSAKEVYYDVNETNSSVDYVVIDPQNEDHVYALLNDKVLIHTLDAGASWQKLNGYNSDGDKIIQIGLLADNRTIFILYERAGLSGSIDGNKWVKIPLNKFSPEQPKNPNESLKETAKTTIANLQEQFVPDTIEPFSKYSRFISLGSPNNPKKPAIILADQEIWVTSDLGKAKFIQQNNLPVQDKKLDVQDFQVNTGGPINKFYVAIGNKILVSENSGKTWSNLNIGIDGVGSISNIILNGPNAEVIYLSLYAGKK